jgi:hypothetical protein
MEQEQVLEIAKEGKFVDGNESVHVVDPKTKFEIDYSMSKRLKRNLDKKIIPSLQKKDKDCILVIDGGEGTGKSTLAFQIGKYVDPTISLSRVVFSPEDFREAIFKAKKGECVIYDEAFTGFSSRSSLSPVNRVLVSLAMQMRQKNLFVLIVLPTIFMLDKYMAIFRTKALIHVFESKGKRGYFRVYNKSKKRRLIIFGQKTMTYNIKGLYVHFKGRFYGKFALGDEKIENEYRKKKEKALQDSEKTSMNSAQVKFREQRDLLIWLFRKYTKLKYRKIENVLADYDFDMSFQQISKICSKFGDIKEDKDIKETKTNEKVEETNELEPIDNKINEKEQIIEDIIEELDENETNEPDNDDL